MADFEDETSKETEETEMKEIFEAITYTSLHTYTCFRTKLNHSYVLKQTWAKHFVDEIPTPPPEA
jgi:hypothetical protein